MISKEKEEQLQNMSISEKIMFGVRIFKSDCMKIAKKNWSEEHVDMLDRLFVAAYNGCEYRCARCAWYEGKPGGEWKCTWEPNELDKELPCKEVKN